MKTLDQIGIEQQTDKASVFTRTYAKPHGYLAHLEPFFEPLRKLPIKFLEIGVGGGESILTWLEYFPNASVLGIDNVKETNPWNITGVSPLEPRYTFVFGDQTDETFYKCFAVDYGDNWDVIIDDGGHYNDQVIASMKGLFPLLRSGGLYVIEDLGTAYGSGSIFVKPEHPNHMDVLKAAIDSMNTNPEAPVRSMRFSRELVIIEKK